MKARRPNGALRSRHWVMLLFVHGLGSRVRAPETTDLVECGGVTEKPTTPEDTREHHTHIQQTNHCTPISSALGQRLQARHAVALRCGVRLLVSTSRKDRRPSLTAPALTVPSRPRLIIRSTSGRARTRFAGLRARRRLAPCGPWPRRASTRHHSSSESNMMIRRSSGPRNRRRTAPTTPGQNLGIYRYRTRSH